MILCGSGHRPQKFVTPDYSWDEVCHDMWHLAYSALEKLPRETIIISGMAVGWDMELCCVAQYLHIPVWAYVPFRGQESKWGNWSKERYHKLLDKCEKVVICSEGGYYPWKMQVRNECMVNDSDVVLALWNGESGGTGNCIKYANQEDTPIWNVYPNWVSGKSVVIPDWLKILHTE